MAGVLKTKPRCFSVSYQNLQTWSVAAQYAVEWCWPDEVIKPLGSILKRRSEAALNTLPPKSFVNLLTIRFDGSIEPRVPVQIQNVKGKLFRVYPGDVIFSKIDVRNGAIGLAPNDIDSMCATSEFPIYSVETEKAHPEYIKLLFRSAVFKKLLNSMISGASGRKRIQPSQLEGVQVPIPPVSVQHKIIEVWENAVRQQASFEKERLNLIKECHSFTLDSLGIKKNKTKPVGKLFCLNWKDSKRWSYEYNKRMLSGLASVQTGSYPTKPLGNICKGVSGSTPSKKNQEYWHNGVLPWVSPKDMKNRIISNSIDYISQKAIEDHQAPTVAEGSILFVVRSGILQHTVPVSITKSKVSINQDIRAFTPQSKEILGDYLLAYFEAKQNELLRLVKWSTTVQSINKEELEQFPIPLPPINTQEDIILNVSKYHRDINTLSERREKSILNTKDNAGKLILGTLSVKDL